MKNKETVILIGVIIIAIILVAVFGAEKKEDKIVESDDPEVIFKNAQKQSESISEEEMKELTPINVDTYLEYYNGEEPKAVLIARPTCGYCQIAEPIIKNIAYKYDLEIYYLNSDDFAGDDTEKFKNSDKYLAEGFGTPLLFSVGNSSIIDKVDGLTDSFHYEDFLKNNGYIK